MTAVDEIFWDSGVGLASFYHRLCRPKATGPSGQAQMCRSLSIRLFGVRRRREG